MVLMTKNIREAIQFEIMGFLMWSIMDDQCNYLTKAEFDSLAKERISALTPRSN